jgi:hypothetical protein
VCEDFSFVFASLIKVSDRSNKQAFETNACFKEDDDNVYTREHTNLRGNPNHYTYTQRNYSNGFESFNFFLVTLGLYIHSPIRLHGVVLKFVEHRDNFTFYLLLITLPKILKVNEWMKSSFKRCFLFYLQKFKYIHTEKKIVNMILKIYIVTHTPIARQRLGKHSRNTSAQQ